MTITESSLPMLTPGQADKATVRGLLLTTLGLLALGVVMVNSAIASVAEPPRWYARVDVRHGIFAALALLVLIVGCKLDYRRLRSGRNFPVLAAVLLGMAVICGGLVFVPGIGRQAGGYWRWVRFGPPKFQIGFQPSELIKVLLVVFLAAYLSRAALNVRSFTRAFLPAVLVTGGCVALIITQDFGTGLIIAVSALVTMLLAGVPWHYLMALVPPAGVGCCFLILNSSYRMARIRAVLDPWCQTNPSAYQPRQALIAIISGGWFGKGPGRGILKFGFLPEDSTDFIFAAFCEEWGFVGAMLLMSLVAMWIWFAWRSAIHAGDKFGRALAGSLGFLIAVQAVMHIMVNVNTMPPTGVSLPFVSAGGTSLVILAGAAALIASVAARGRPNGLIP